MDFSSAKWKKKQIWTEFEMPIHLCTLIISLVIAYIHIRLLEVGKGLRKKVVAETYLKFYEIILQRERERKLKLR